jgi:hypothetical protein
MLIIYIVSAAFIVGGVLILASSNINNKVFN